MIERPQMSLALESTDGADSTWQTLLFITGSYSKNSHTTLFANGPMSPWPPPRLVHCTGTVVCTSVRTCAKCVCACVRTDLMRRVHANVLYAHKIKLANSDMPSEERLLYISGGWSEDRISAIAAMTTDGVLSYELVRDTVDGEKFLDFVRGAYEFLDGLSSKSIVIMDNCLVHHTQEVRDDLQNAGILVIFLPSYSPDYMPIELCFSYIKYYLTSHDDLLRTVSDPTPVISSAFQSVNRISVYKLD